MIEVPEGFDINIIINAIENEVASKRNKLEEVELIAYILASKPDFEQRLSQMEKLRKDIQILSKFVNDLRKINT